MECNEQQRDFNKDTELEREVLKANQPVLVYFGHPGVVKLMSPLIDWAAQTYSDRLKVVKMEVDLTQLLSSSTREGVLHG